LVPFLPVPVVEYNGKDYFMDYDRPCAIGKVKSFYGNFGVVIKAYAYIRSLGADGLRETSETAVLNANYIRVKLQDHYSLPYSGICMHEVVFSALKQTAFGVSALDIAKRLIDFDYHPPTIYFPLIVREALMVEPTETESKETLDEFIEAMKQIAEEAENNPELVKGAPHNTVVLRLDEVQAARNPVLRYIPASGL
jgi:Glycine cleavage system protein P (pyridoxal-binding), C-terminal domain